MFIFIYKKQNNMKLEQIIENTIKEYINESWYHGTADSREIEKLGGFNDRFMSVDYITDLDKYNQLMIKLKETRNTNEKEYFRLLDLVGNYKKQFKYNKPIFLTDSLSVAKTYADDKRAFDYQNAEEKVYEVDVDCNKVVKISAYGDRFRYINIDKVKNGFINAGVSEDEITNLINKFNFYSNNKGIQTDVIAGIGSWLKFDCIDVMGVLDSYQGGNVKSTVRMVLNPSKIRIKK